MRRPLPPLRPKRAACGVAGLRSGAAQRRRAGPGEHNDLEPIHTDRVFALRGTSETSVHVHRLSQHVEALHKTDGDKALREFRTFECEQMLTSIARNHDLCRSTLAHIKHFLGGAFRYARRQGVLDSPNPMREVEIPRGRPAGETHAYSLEEEIRMLAILPEPAATVVAMAAFTGARKGEIRGFLWQNYDGYTIEVKHSVWRNQVGEPKREEQRNHSGDRAVETLSRSAPGFDGKSCRGIYFSKSLGQPVESRSAGRVK
ncbi:MAG: hypothetical protein QOG55_3841 [Acidobacteriaceae bacterium]|nr:hypothetical protein [Acidobacteriaceae bacterium]